MKYQGLNQMGKKIISFSLWGNEPMYTIGAIKNAELAKTTYPDWICRFYLGDDVSEDIVSRLQSFDNTEVIIMPHKENDWQGMFWRFYAVNTEEDVDYVIFRDADSRLNLREYEAVTEWINSGKYFHIMRDHPYHTEAIMGGMWGCKPKELLEKISKEIYGKISAGPVHSLEKVIDDWIYHETKSIEEKRPKHLEPEQLITKGIDQIFLRGLIYLTVFQDAYIHDSYPEYNCFSGRFDYQYNPNGKEINTGFPSRRGTAAAENWNNFVGQVYDENDIPVEEYANLLKERDKCIYMDWGKV
jgi:hypothetical protein